MLPRRPTIARIIFLIIIIAIDCAMLRDWYNYSYYRKSRLIPGFTVFEFGMINLLAISLDRAVFSGEKIRPFSRGFFLSGMIPLTAMSLYCVTHSRWEMIVALNPILS